MAELLIQAKSHWMDNFTQAQIDALDDNAKASRNARIQLGDIVVVRPDGWEWGKEECLPNYVVVKLPQVSVATVEHFVQSLMVQDGVDSEGRPIMKMLRKRKWQVPNAYVQQVLNAGESVVTVTLSNKQLQFINNLVEKTS